MFEPSQPRLISACGLSVTLDIERFSRPPTRSERRFLRRLHGPVIDIGCGPGRAAAYLRRRGVPALGLDISEGLVDLARANGALCAHQSVFDPVPFEGRWSEVLLLDGNIGIGGDPSKLLDRIQTIVGPAGRALVEVTAVGPTRNMVVREHVGDLVGEPFPWAVVSLAGLDALIEGSDWHCEDIHRIDERLVAQLVSTR